MTDISVQNYYYDGQIKDHLLQFMAIFSGMHVSIGKNDYESKSNLIPVHIVHGHRDRVVSAVFSDNTQNKMLKLPLMAANIVGLQLATDRLSGQNQERKEIKLKRGGMIPDDLQQTTMVKPIPYRISMELAINTSNLDHNYQILEQILLLFNPSIQIQVSDTYGDLQSHIEVFLDGINIQDNYPAGTDQRIVSTTLNFNYVMYLSSPVNLRDEIIKNIKVRISNALDPTRSPSEVNAGVVDPFIISADNWQNQ